MQWLYLFSLLLSIGGLLLLDHQYKLAFFHNAKRTLRTLLPAIGLFILWDAIGIALGIFYHGGSMFALPYRIAPEFPIEELVFLFLLCYVTLLTYLGWERKCSRT